MQRGDYFIILKTHLVKSGEEKDAGLIGRLPAYEKQRKKKKEKKKNTYTYIKSAAKKKRKKKNQHSHVADVRQEGADQAGVTPADVPLKGALHPVLDVANLHPAGVPAHSQVAQRRAQHKVVLPQLRRGTEVEHVPQLGVQEDLAQLAARQREAPATVLVQEGEEVEEALAVELGDVHGEGPQSEREASSACWRAATMSLQPVLCGLDT